MPMENVSAATSPTSLSDGRLKAKNACTSCALRKTKCDRLQPCAQCAKANLECIYRAPPPPQRRKRKFEGASAVLEKLRQHEEALKSAGIPFEAFDVASIDISDRPGRNEEHAEYLTPERHVLPFRDEKPVKMSPGVDGKLVTDRSGQRYNENGLVASLSKEFEQDPRDVVGEESSPGMNASIDFDPSAAQQIAGNGGSVFFGRYMGSSLILGVPLQQSGTSFHHPPPATVMKLWTIFLDNVNPVTKLLHVPSTNQKLLDATSSPESISRGMEALMFSIYACAVVSMTEKECRKLLGDARDALLLNYQSASQHALLACGILKPSEIIVLQAFVLMLTSMQENTDPCSLWTLLGVAVRIGQGLGLHRDGTSLGLSAFETEMRRRLWWNIVVLDARVAEMSGYGISLMPNQWDTMIPLNVNDSELALNSMTLPKESPGLSEMTFCLLRYETAQFLQRPECKISATTDWVSPGGRAGSKEDKTSELENFLENKFLRSCDPIVPLHVLTTTMARSTICKLRHIAHSKATRKGSNITQEEKDEAFAYSLRILEYDNHIHSTKSTQRFLWYVRNHFPWGALIPLLKEMSTRPATDVQVQTAWRQVEELYGNHPEFADDKKAFNRMVRALTMKAWAAHEASASSLGLERPEIPEFIETLLPSQSHPSISVDVDTANPLMQNAGNLSDLTGQDQSFIFNWDGSFTPFDTANMSLDGINWPPWGGMMDDFQ